MPQLLDHLLIGPGPTASLTGKEKKKSNLRVVIWCISNANNSEEEALMYFIEDKEGGSGG